ncbi:DUF6916 family protein [Tropicibacter sp. S64]|uniref:DUF6916 family protein n=1 Tax=Tropicibacter sp. S64 TaxID=3415122 RepID=UPI003C7CA55F
MTNQTRMSRRAAVAGTAVCAAAAALPGTASALSDPAPRTAPASALTPRWTSATADELASFVGQRFRFRSADHGTIALTLVGVVAHVSGPGRPAQLPRREGVTALFDGPDMAPMVAAQHGMYTISHPRLGGADLYVTAAPRRDGRAYIELVLN